MKKAIFRLVAYLLDFLILGIVLVGFQLLLYLSTNGFPFNSFSKSYQIYLWVLCTISLPTWLYFILLEMSIFQATYGKRFFHLKVVNKQDSHIGFIESFIRTFIRLLPWEITHFSLLPIYFSKNPQLNIGIWIADVLILLYVITILLKKGNMTMHDYFSKTKVVFE